MAFSCCSVMLILQSLVLLCSSVVTALAPPTQSRFASCESRPRLRLPLSKNDVDGCTINGSNRSPHESTKEAQHKDRRSVLQNLILLSSINTGTIIPKAAHAFSFGSGGLPKEVKPTVATDITGNPVFATTYLSKKGAGDYTMVQGLKGDPTYLLVDANGSELESYALNAECTHLGCIVPWDSIQKKFICPCHGSQYDGKGVVLRGPAPGALKLAKVQVEEESGKVLLSSWDEDDFRTGEKPWWL